MPLPLARRGAVADTSPRLQMLPSRRASRRASHSTAGEEVSSLHYAVVSRGADVSGVVRDGMGRPVAAGTVVIFPLERANWHPRSPHVASVRTDGQGSCVLKNLPRGEYRIVAAGLPSDPWLDADAPSELFDRSVAARLEASRVLAIDLTMR